MNYLNRVSGAGSESAEINMEGDDMKRFVLAVALSLALMVSVPAMAFGGIFGDNYTTNEGGKGGKGGNASATATVMPGAVKVDNKNTNCNSNRNTNLNSNKNTNVNINRQGQGQQQGQLQGQLQGQGQSQEANNEGNLQKMKLEQTFEDKRDHIVAPGIVSPDAKVVPMAPFDIKVHHLSGMLDEIVEIDKASSRMLAKDTDDVDVNVAVLFENTFSTDKVLIGRTENAKLMGFIYVTATGTDISAPGAFGKAAEIAMKLGATSVVLGDLTGGTIGTGSSFNIGIGGGASIMVDGDSKAIAPSGGTGYGKAKSSTEYLPALRLDLYFDADYVGDTVEKDDPANFGH